MNIRKRLFFLLAVLSASRLGGQPMSIDTNSQYQLYLKVLAFDKTLISRAGHTLVFGVLFARGSRESRRIKDEMLRVIAEGPKEFEGLPIRSVAVALTDQTKLDEDLAREGVDILYISPLDPYDVRSVAPISRARGISTFTGVVEYVFLGMSVSFRMVGRGAKILVNLTASRAEGSDFSSRLLDMVTVVDEPRAGVFP
jgi:hypothetical protein